MTPAKTASFIAAGAVAIGFADLPYGYYLILRLFLSGVSLFLMFGAGLALEAWCRWILGGLALLYNSVLPVRIGDKAIWEVLNVATVLLFWFVASRQDLQIIAYTHLSSTTASLTGTIARLRIDKGFGFICDDGGIEYFFHRSSMRGCVFELVRQGQRVEFEPQDSQKGPRATNVQLIEG